MDSVKKGWYVCKSNFIQWRTNYRIWMIVAIETILVFRYLHGLSEYGQATGKTITPFVLPTVSINKFWGEIAGDFVVNQRSLIPVYTWGLVMPVRVIQNYYPLAAFIYTFITGWLSMVFIGKLMYLLNLKNGKKTIGISAAVFFIMLDPVAVYFTIFKKYGLFYVSPINWSSLENINTVSGYPYLSGGYMFVMYIVLIVAESLMSYICSIKMDIEIKIV